VRCPIGFCAFTIEQFHGVSLDKTSLFSLLLPLSLRIPGNRRNRSARLGEAVDEAVAEILPRLANFGSRKISGRWFNMFKETTTIILSAQVLNKMLKHFFC
jgi:hypothetical protein